MIIFPILLAFLTGLILLRLCNQHKFLNIFEQLVLGFVSALSLFVLELFLGGIIFNELSLIGPILTFVILLSIFIYKIIQSPSYREGISKSIKDNFLDVKQQFLSIQLWKRYLVIAIGIYVLVKIFMVFQINTSMPTFDEDAVTGRDIKTKVFTENKSLLLDKTSPEFLGSALERIAFAPLTDTYFLLSENGDLTGLTNIISPLMYLLSILLLFGIFLRKANIFFAILSGYVFVSLPFVFIHGFGSYWNLPFACLVFIFGFYLSELFIRDQRSIDWGMVILLGIVSFLAVGVRNEGFILVGVIWLVTLLFHYIKNKSFFSQRNNLIAYGIIILGLFLSVGLNNYLKIITPSGVDAQSHLNMLFGEDAISKIFSNLSQESVFIAPFQQMFYRSDYNLLFVVLIFSLLYMVFTKKINSVVIQFIGLFFILLFLLWANLDFGLVSHIGFIRYGILVSIYAIFIIISYLYEFYKKNMTSEK